MTPQMTLDEHCLSACAEGIFVLWTPERGLGRMLPARGRPAMPRGAPFAVGQQVFTSWRGFELVLLTVTSIRPSRTCRSGWAVTAAAPIPYRQPPRDLDAGLFTAAAPTERGGA